MILYEITIQVRQFCVKILFNDIPTIGSICDAVSQIFANELHVQKGMLELVLSVGDDTDRRATKLEIGDEVRFTEDDQPIGLMDLQTRTLFNA